jgi:hypothetical protein
MISSTSFAKYHLKRPVLTGVVKFEHLLLPLQIVLLVVAGNPSIGDGAPLRLWRMKKLWPKPRKVVAALSTRCALIGQKVPFMLPSTQSLGRYAKKISGLLNANHLARHDRNIRY